MVLAPIAAWVKQADYLTGDRIDPRDVWTLEVVAVKTGEGEIVGGSLAPMGYGDDVVKLKRRAHERFRQQAILATETGAAKDEFLKLGLDPHALSGRRPRRDEPSI